MAAPYGDVLDFAFFAANLGYTKADYEALTWTEIEFVKKAWENRTVRNTNLENAAHHAALVNANRKKGKSAIPVLKKRAVRAVDPEKVAEFQATIERIKKRDEATGKDWVKKIYQGGRP